MLRIYRRLKGVVLAAQQQDVLGDKVAAEMIGVSREYIRQLIHAGKIKAQLSGSIWIINRASLMKFKEQRDAA